MAAIPYMRLYVADYLADTAHLSTLEHGIYLLLIMNYWQMGKALPDDDKKLARICHLSEKKFQKAKPNVIEFFSVLNGKWKHMRIELELARIRSMSRQKQVAGQISAQKKKDIKSTRVEQVLDVCSTDAEHMLNYTDTDTDTEYKKENIKEKQKSLPQKTKRKRVVPENFELTQQHRELAFELKLDVTRERVQFVDYWMARGDPKADWDAAFRNWLRKAEEFKNNSQGRENHDRKPTNNMQHLQQFVDQSRAENGTIQEGSEPAGSTFLQEITTDDRPF